MKKIGFVYKRGTNALLSETAEKWADYVRGRGFETFLTDVAEPLRENADVLVVLGGDGSMLQAAERVACSGTDTPLLGINMGRVGFLADSEQNGAGDALDRLLNGEYTVIERIAAEGFWGGKRVFALNEISVKGGDGRPAQICARVNGEHIGDFMCDGILLSTPTGSTAYNLSAGGPVIAPNAECFALTLVARYGFGLKSLVISAKDTVEVCASVIDKSRVLTVSADGRTRDAVTPGEQIIIKRAPKTIKFIKTANALKDGFYDIVRRKL